MFTAVFLSAVALAAPVPKVTKPVGPPPTLVYVHPATDGRVTVSVRTTRTVTENYTVIANENGVQVSRVAQREVERPLTTLVTLDNAAATFATVDEKKLTADEATARLKAGGVLVVPTDGDEVDGSYLKALAADAILVTYVGKGAERKTMLPARLRTETATPVAPALVAMKADAKGLVNLPAKGTKEETVSVSVLEIENGVPVTKTREVKRTVATLVPTPFDDVKPDVTTADGKTVTAGDAKKGLAAGALVLVSGDGKPVDEAFRKAVRPTTLVLVSPKMALPGRLGIQRAAEAMTLPVPAR